MQNLKITMTLNEPVILDRTTTIDGILLWAFYNRAKKKGINIPFDKDHKKINFIHKENGVFSGSIWYIDKDAYVDFDFVTFIKNPEYRKLFDFTGSKKRDSAQFKGFMGTDEIMITKEIYFYIKGDKEIIEKLLRSEVRAIGKKQSVGFGEVKNIFVDEIEHDKGFMLNESTPSKPLPVDGFEVKSKKVMQIRRKPPYWLEEDVEPCYMPTTALYELTDNSFANKAFSYKIQPFEHNCLFLFNNAHTNSRAPFKQVDVDKFKNFKHKKIKSHWVEDNKELLCSVTKHCSSSGMKGDVREFIGYVRNKFSDFDVLTNNDFLSHEVLWCLENMVTVAYTYVDKKDWVHIQGRYSKKNDKPIDGQQYKDFVKNPKKLKPPFSMNLKENKNAKHIAYRGKVSISNAFFIVQYGDSQLKIDNELLQEAILDLKKIADTLKISKTALCRDFRDKNNYSLAKKADNIENRNIVFNFQKKYNKDIRILLDSVKLE